MRVTVFFVCLCILLLRGYGYVMAGGDQGNSYFKSIQHIEKAQKAKFTETHEEFAIIKDASPDEEDEYLISDEVENEDTNSLFARKYILLARCYLMLSFLVMSRYLHKCSGIPRTLYSPLSYKYITQQVLRI